MSRRTAVVAALLLAFAAAAVVLPMILKSRVDANMLAARNNLRELALFAAHHANPEPGRDAGRLLNHVPAGTIFLPGVPPDDRLSWVVPVLPGLDQKRQDLAPLFAQIDQTQPWTAARNQEAARTRLVVMLSPEGTPQVPADRPAVACYVGIAGLGTDAATLVLPEKGPVPPRAGAFRYDAPTPFDKIADGLSQTLLFAETANDVGPWLRGGPSTVRGVDDSSKAKPLIGADGQFGGYFPNGANVALCDGSVRLFTPQTTPEVLFRMATIAGKDEGIVGD